MPSEIVLCLDGTSNKFAAANTNVVKLYAMLDRTRPDQFSYYQPGIGTIPPPGVWGKFKQWFITRLDLAIAWLLPNHVSDAYRFLMRYYQDGDSSSSSVSAAGPTRRGCWPACSTRWACSRRAMKS